LPEFGKKGRRSVIRGRNRKMGRGTNQARERKPAIEMRVKRGLVLVHVGVYKGIA